MTDRLTQPELESYLWGAAIILRGLVDAGDYKQHFPAVFYKRSRMCGTRTMPKRSQRPRTKTTPSRWRMSGLSFHPKRIGTMCARRQRMWAKPSRMRFGRSKPPTPSNWTGSSVTRRGQTRNACPTTRSRIYWNILQSNRFRLPTCPKMNWATVEFLIKKFADDSGHTAQEFYTNRTVVHLMVQMLEPKPGEKIYDPTCGTGGS